MIYVCQECVVRRQWPTMTNERASVKRIGSIRSVRSVKLVDVEPKREIPTRVRIVLLMDVRTWTGLLKISVQ